MTALDWYVDKWIYAFEFDFSFSWFIFSRSY